MTERDLRTLLVAEAVAFGAAALVHFGIGVQGFEDASAGTAEAITAIVLVAGVAAGSIQAELLRTAALLAQGFALAGTLVGLVLNVVVGPASAPDVVFHAVMVGVLAWGLVGAWRTGSGVATGA
jgi:hypothetical protein